MLQGSGSGSQSGAIANSGGTTNVMSLVKTGSGTWNLSGANTYTGTTAVNGGLLTVSGAAGSIAQSTALTVSGGTVQLDDSALANNFSSSRLGSQPITLQGGRLERQPGQRQRRHGDDRLRHGGDGREHAGPDGLGAAAASSAAVRSPARPAPR